MPAVMKIVAVFLLLLLSALIIWMWLLIQAIRVINLCPSGCWCDPGGTTIDCTNGSLFDIPRSLHGKIQDFVLSYNNFITLQKNVFYSTGLSQLKILELNGCELETIELGAFNGLKMLRQLLLMNNKLREMKSGLFINLVNLEELDLSNNLIQTVEASLFLGLVSLHYLTLSKNSIRNLHSEMFQNTPKLRTLSLEGNKGLVISKNRPFLNLPTLKNLDLSDCNISSIEGISFGNMSDLQLLDLRRNNFRSVKSSVFETLKNLSFLYLYENPLECNCLLQQVWLVCQTRNIVTATNDEIPTCKYPDEVSGLWWGVLQQSRCVNGDISYYGIVRSLVDDNIYYDFYYEYEDFLMYGQSIIFSILFIFGAIGNAALVVIILCNQEMRTIPNMCLLNLALSDLLSLTINLPVYHLHLITEEWEYAPFTCKVYIFLRRLSVGSAAYSVAVLSVQRYHVTVMPFDNRINYNGTKRFAVTGILTVWFLASMFALPSIFSVRQNMYCSVHYSLKYHQYVVSFDLLVSCIFPLCVIMFTYITTARHLVQNARSWSQEMEHPKVNMLRKTAKIVLSLVFVFLISFLPYHILWTYYIWEDTPFAKTSWYIHFVSSCFLVFNSCFNPIALCVSSRAFRLHFKKYFLCCLHKRTGRSTISLFFNRTKRNMDTSHETEEEVL